LPFQLVDLQIQLDELKRFKQRNGNGFPQGSRPAACRTQMYQTTFMQLGPASCAVLQFPIRLTSNVVSSLHSGSGSCPSSWFTSKFNSMSSGSANSALGMVPTRPNPSNDTAPPGRERLRGSTVTNAARCNDRQAKKNIQISG
jgi:hypothetical protein